jgi:hypothetical protein
MPLKTLRSCRYLGSWVVTVTTVPVSLVVSPLDKMDDFINSHGVALASRNPNEPSDVA